QKFKAAGFITLGKTNTPELGLTATTEPEAFGASRNPWDVSRSTGGSIGDSWHGLAIEGVVCRSVRDSAAVLDAIAGAMPGDPYSSPPQNRPFRDEVGAAPGKLRIGFMKRTPQGSDPLH